MKRKRIASISMAHIEDIGELEGKKSLFEDILVFFLAKEIWKEPGDSVVYVNSYMVEAIRRLQNRSK